MAVMAKPVKLAFVIDSKKADEFINLKPDRQMLQKIRQKSDKIKGCIVQDERHKR